MASPNATQPINVPAEYETIIRIAALPDGTVARTVHKPTHLSTFSGRLLFLYHSKNFYAANDFPEGQCPAEAIYNGLLPSSLNTVRQIPGGGLVVLTTPIAEGYASKMLERAVLRKRCREGFQLSAVHTACRDCIFASYESNTQVGCTFNKRLDKFRQQGQGVVVGAYDDSKKFFVINGRKCHAFRDREWAKFYAAGERATVVRREMTMRVDAIIHIDKAWGQSASWLEEALDRTIETVKYQDVPFHQIIVINNRSELKTSKIISMLNESKLGIPWRLTDIRRDITGALSHDRCIDEAFNHLKGHFYASFAVGFQIPTNYVKAVDVAVNDRMERFMVALPYGAGYSGLLVHPSIHRNSIVTTANTDQNKLLYQRFVDYANETEQHHMVANIRELLK